MVSRLGQMGFGSDEIKQMGFVLLCRHELHQGSGYREGPENVLLPEAIERARIRGCLLKKLGFTPDAVYAAPVWDQVGTMMYTLEGCGEMVQPIYMKMGLGDTSLDKELMSFRTDEGKTFKQQVVETSKKRFPDGPPNGNKDAGLATVILEDETLHQPMIRRGQEGAQALCEIANENMGKVAMAFTSAVARYEVSIRALEGHQGTEMLDFVDELCPYGGITLLVMNYGKVVIKQFMELLEDNAIHA